MYRYRQGIDYTETNTFDDKIRRFIILSTFTGPTKGILKELSTEVAMKIFQYGEPVLFLFRNTSEPRTHTYYEKEFLAATDRLKGELLVCLADINNEIS